MDEPAPPTEPSPEPSPEAEPPEPAPPPAAPPGLEVVAALRRGLAASFRAFPRALPVILPVIAIAQTASVLGSPGLALEPYRTPGLEPPPAGPGDWLALAGVLLFELSIGTWAQCALLVTVEAALEGEPVPDFGHAYGRGLTRVPALLGTSLLLTCIVGLGFVACVVPGLWALALLSFAVPRAVVRGEGVGTALRHSYLLARGRGFRLLGAFVLVGAIVAPIVMTSSLVLMALSASGHPPVDAASRLPYIVVPVVATSLTAVLAPGMQLALHARLEELGPRA